MVRIQPNDTVILSATPVPGNEKMVNRTINNLFRQGAEVFYQAISNVHVSGHGAQEELKLMLGLLRPQFFMPVHGEYRQLFLHEKLAQRSRISQMFLLAGFVISGLLLQYGKSQTTSATANWTLLAFAGLFITAALCRFTSAPRSRSSFTASMFPPQTAWHRSETSWKSSTGSTALTSSGLRSIPGGD